MRKCCFFILIFVSAAAMAQDSFHIQPAKAFDVSLHAKSNSRKWLVGTASVLGYGGSFIFLNEAWYKGYPRSSFHTFNDAGEWMQMDKIGHAWTAYHTSRINTDLWKWAGVSDRKSVLLGSGTSLLYMLSIEYLDGRSAEWGWSWPDAGADIFGASLFAAQQLTWEEQKISIKFSSHRKNYTPASLEQRANDLFGKSLQERLLKDYNAQTYWLSLNLRSILKSSQLPSWLNIAVGYGADNMFGGYENLAFDKNGNVLFDRRDIKRYRQWYLAPDIDLTKIKTKSSFLKTVFSLVNVLKIPAPALELSNGKLKGHWIAF
ncbi:MAG: DUF2279 domain-containing protein [Flavisolibacter sp.]